MKKNSVLNEEELLKVTGGTTESEKEERREYCDQYSQVQDEDKRKEECNADPKCKYNKWALKNIDTVGCRPKKK